MAIGLFFLMLQTHGLPELIRVATNENGRQCRTGVQLLVFRFKCSKTLCRF